MLDWVFPSGMKVKFAHLEHEKTVYNYQGSQIPLICCEENEKVKTPNGLKKISDLKTGDLILTLQGPKKLVFKGNRRLEDCVEFQIGNIRQVHSLTHKILTNDGWVSYADKSYVFHPFWIFLSTLYCFFCKFLKSFASVFLTLLPLLYNPLKDLLRRFEVLKLIQDYSNLRVISFYRELKGLGSYCVSSLCERLKLLLRPSVHFYAIRSLQDFELKDCAYDYIQSPDEVSCVQSELKLSNLKLCYLFLSRLCDVLAVWKKDSIPNAFQQLDDVELQNQKDLLWGDRDKAQIYIHRKLQYDHPYRGLKRKAEGLFCLVPSIAIPCGKKWVCDLTIEDESHYITESGLVNKNCFDELTHFSQKQFFYMLSRNRSTSGVAGYIRATCNPDADSWVRSFIDYWIDKDGFPIKERGGKVRWFMRREDQFIWANSRQELLDKYGQDELPKSVTFIPSSIYDNQILIQKDPAYLANLKSLSRVDRLRLLGGNWNVRESAGSLFQKEWFPIVEAIPAGWTTAIRFWDRACLIADTKIRVPNGYKNIDKIKIGDLVFTRNGYREVTWSGISKTTNNIYSIIFSNGIVLSGTSCHPVYTINRGWVKLGELKGYDRVLTEREIWNSLNKLRMGKNTPFSMGVDTISTIKDTITTMNGTVREKNQFIDYYTETCMNTIMAPFPMAVLYTTKMETELITELKILSVCQENSMDKTINQTCLSKLILKIQNTALKHRKLYSKKQMSQKELSVCGVGKNLIKKALKQNTVILNVVPVDATDCEEIPVYDLSVKTQPEFIANGILVHNSTKPNETNKDPDFTRGLKLFKYHDNTFIVADLKSMRDTPHQVERLIKNVALHDSVYTKIVSQQDPGSAGVYEADNFIRMLSGFDVKTVIMSKDKITRAKPVSAQAEAGNIKVLRAPWNDEFFTELENFPDGLHDDIVDCLSGSFNELSTGQSIMDVYHLLR